MEGTEGELSDLAAENGAYCSFSLEKDLVDAFVDDVEVDRQVCCTGSSSVYMENTVGLIRLVLNRAPQGDVGHYRVFFRV